MSVVSAVNEQSVASAQNAVKAAVSASSAMPKPSP